METPAGTLTEAEQRAVMSKVTRRLVPLLFFCYIIAYIDRINVGFAKPHLEPILGVDPKIFGFGSGLFFIGYFLFEVPSNLILQKVGARIWIARIMIVWGFVSMSFMFLTGPTMFYILRFLLGAAEAGFFPGILLYFTYWYPVKNRAKTIALFALGGVAAGVIGSPLSGALLELDGMGGLAGWQWLFLLESIPAVVMGFVVLWILPNGPADARWLTLREKDWLQGRLDEDVAQAGSAPAHRLRDVFTNGRVWLLCLLYFLMNVAGYGYEFWSPTIIRQFGEQFELTAKSDRNDLLIGFINAIPYIAAGIAMTLVGRNSDRSGERRGHVAVSAIAAAAGFGIAAMASNPWMALGGLILALSGIKSTLGPFWALGTTALRGSFAAAGGIAFINSVGNLGGYAGPHLVGVIKSARPDGSNMLALLVLGGALVAMAVLSLLLPGRERRAD
jgi:ACS family tartrate transporter-like MFS transporter